MPENPQTQTRRSTPLDVVKTSRLLDSVWYADRYPDLQYSGLSAAEHYLSIGAGLLRDPGPGFSSAAYLDAYPDVKASGMNPLVHFELYGIGETREIFPARRRPPPPSPPARDALQEGLLHLGAALNSLGDAAPDCETLFRTKAGDLRRRFCQHFDEIKATVLMPLSASAPAPAVSGTLASVLQQTHGCFELLILPVGPWPDGAQPPFSRPNDPRLRWRPPEAPDLVSALNTGLEQASGHAVFYLEPGTIWADDFLAQMLVCLDIPGVMTAHADIRHTGSQADQVFRFDWFACTRGTAPADLRTFGHHRELFHQSGGFDPGWREYAPRELILRYVGQGRRISCPVIGLEGPAPAPVEPDLSKTPPALEKLVRHKAWLGLSTQEAAASVPLNIAIKTHAIFRLQQNWGEFFFARSLQSELEKLGHQVRIDFPETWYSSPEGQDDVAIVLRGRIGYDPRPGEISALWVITHPDQIPYEEYDRFDAVFVASPSYPALLSAILERDVHTLLQCTDSALFGYQPQSKPAKGPGIFVGNSRNEYRDIIRWSVQNFADIRIFGQHWEQFIPPYLIAGQNIPNAKLAKPYASASYVLNDHWESSRDFGIIANRVFDVLGVGGALVSDHIPSIPFLFGNAVTCVQNRAEFRAFLDQDGANAPSKPARKQAADYIHAEHSFKARAGEIMRHVTSCLMSETMAAPAVIRPLAERPRPRLGLIARSPEQEAPAPDSFVRLISPLTTDRAHSELDLIPLSGPGDARANDCELIAMAASAAPRGGDAERLAEQIEQCGISLFIDAGDPAISAMHPPRPPDPDPALLTLAKEIWHPTQGSAECFPGRSGQTRLVANTADPRLWKNYLTPRAPRDPASPARLLYLASPGSLDDFPRLIPAFETLFRHHPNTFHLTVVGETPALPEAPWFTQHQLVGPLLHYPHLARWLAQGHFDAGIIPAPTGPNQDGPNQDGPNQDGPDQSGSDIRFLEYSALGLPSLVSERVAWAGSKTAELACLCPSTQEGWADILADFLRRPAYYDTLGARAQAHLWETRNALHAPLSLQVFDLA